MQDTVATTGSVHLTPNAVNSVPQTADVTIDLRDVDERRRDDILATILEAAKHFAEKRGVEVGGVGVGYGMLRVDGAWRLES